MSRRGRKTALINRSGETIYLRVQSAPHTHDDAISVFLLHGYGDGMDTPLMQVLEARLLKQGYRVINIDASHSFNDSDGKLESHTPTKHWHDLEDVIAWAKEQSWFSPPYGLVGHSVGGLACLLHAQNLSQQALDDPNTSIAFIAPIATAVSGQALEEALKDGAPAMFQSFQEKGFQWIYNQWNPKAEKKAKRSIGWLTDMKQHDIMPSAAKLHMPLFLCSGDQDIPTPPSQQRMLLSAWGSNYKSYYEIAGCDHDFSQSIHRKELSHYFEDWLITMKSPKATHHKPHRFKP